MEVDDKAVKTFNDFAAIVRDKKAGDKLKVKVEREGKPVEVEVTLEARPAPAGTGQGREPAPPRTRGGGGGLGLNPDRPFGAVLGGQIENVQDRQGPDGFQTGGVYKSTDGGESWTRVNSLNPRPMYFSQVRVDPTRRQVRLRPRAAPSTARPTAARRSGATAAGASTPTTTPSGSTRATAGT